MRWASCLRIIPDEIYAVRKDSPLIVGKSADGSFIASDVPAILKYTRTVYYVENQEVVKLTEGRTAFLHRGRRRDYQGARYH